MAGTVHVHPTKPSAPAFTMRGRESAPEKQNKNPGPGQYGHSTSLSKQTNKFGNEQRRSNSMSVAPGPGQYVIKPKAVEGPGYTMRAKTNSSSFSIDSPGPGKYNAKVPETHETQVYSMGARRNPKKDINVEVGPGAYNFEANATHQKSPTWRFGSEQRKQEKGPKGVPGPGQYKFNSRIQEGPQYGFGSTSKDTSIKHPNANLGPASYTLPAWTKTEKGLSMTPRRPLNADKQKNFVPGPGQYEQPICERKQPTWKIGNDIRKSLSSISNVPGPGNYSIPERRGTSVGFGTAKRQASGTLSSTSPGPGSYAIPSRAREGPNFSMRAKTQTHNKQVPVPGPGNYDHTNNTVLLQKSPKFGMGTSARSDAKISTVPGPGQYNTRGKPAEGPNYGFGTEAKQKSKKIEDPGYNYDLPGTFPKLPKSNLSSQMTSPRVRSPKA